MLPKMVGKTDDLVTSASDLAALYFRVVVRVILALILVSPAEVLIQLWFFGVFKTCEFELCRSLKRLD